MSSLVQLQLDGKCSPCLFSEESDRSREALRGREHGNLERQSMRGQTIAEMSWQNVDPALTPDTKAKHSMGAPSLLLPRHH